MKISLQVIETEEHKEARGINLELSRYANTIFNFCELAKDKKINITIDLGCNFSDSFVKLQIKKFLGLQTETHQYRRTKKSYSSNLDFL